GPVRGCFHRRWSVFRRPLAPEHPVGRTSRGRSPSSWSGEPARWRPCRSPLPRFVRCKILSGRLSYGVRLSRPMAVQAEARSRPRVRLSTERVFRAAIPIADKRGIEALTMRNLAEELGVEAMTLYYYVAKKDEIVNGILDLVVDEIDVPSSGGDWKTALRRSAISAHEVLLRHPWACSLMMSPARIGPARLRYMESLLGRLREAGFSANMTHHAYHALDSHILGF